MNQENVLPLKKLLKLSGYLILSSAILALILALLFRVNSPQKTKSGTTENSNLFFMHPDPSTDNPKLIERAKEDKLNLNEEEALLSYDDPTIISFPNSKYGYSLKENERLNEPPVPQVSLYNYPLEDVKLVEGKRIPLIENVNDPTITISASNLITLPKLGEIIVGDNKTVSTNELIWYVDNKASVPPFNLEQVKKIITETAPIAPTEIKIKMLNSTPLVYIIQKCGTPQLDKLVLDYLNQKILAVYSGKLSPEKMPQSILIEWHSPLSITSSPK